MCKNHIDTTVGATAVVPLW